MLENCRKWCVATALGCSIVLVPGGDSGFVAGQEKLPPPLPAPAALTIAEPTLPSPLPEERPLPINLPTALGLVNARAWDIIIAADRVRVAAALLQRANVLWLPTLVNGVDYQHHDGRYQLPDGSAGNQSRSGIEVGMAPEAVFNISDAIFEPLAARQVVVSRRADLQAATNDTTLSVALAYFDVEEARGDLAGTQDVVRRTRQMLKRIESLAPAIVPHVEVARARAQLAHFDQTEQSTRERWNVTGAELIRILRLDPAAVVVPYEPPHLQITLVPPAKKVDELLPIALANRPELASYQALVRAALDRWRQERFRPFVPSIYGRGGSTQLPDSMAFGVYGTGQGSSLNHFGIRDDFEVQVMWEFQNMGLGNLAAMRQRRAEYEVANAQGYRLADLVAREVAQAYAQLRSAATRVGQAERELRQAVESADQNFEGMSEVKRAAGNINILVIRPQEAIASVQALTQAYFDYYGSVADYNRAEFQMFRALGNPAQALLAPDGPFAGPGDAPLASTTQPTPANPLPAKLPPVNPAQGNGQLSNRPQAGASSSALPPVAASQDNLPQAATAMVGQAK